MQRTNLRTERKIKQMTSKTVNIGLPGYLGPDDFFFFFFRIKDRDQSERNWSCGTGYGGKTAVVPKLG